MPSTPVVLWTWGQGVKHNFVVIVLLTASHVPSLAPLKGAMDSMHEEDIERDLPAPFTELPFNVHII
jgi:hypothetical protein